MDLDGITTRLKALQRHAGTTDYASKVIADCAALLAEVERLREKVRVIEEKQAQRGDNGRF